MTQQLRVHTIPEEDMGSSPSTHRRLKTSLKGSASGTPQALELTCTYPTHPNKHINSN